MDTCPVLWPASQVSRTREHISNNRTYEIKSSNYRIISCNKEFFSRHSKFQNGDRLDCYNSKLSLLYIGNC